MKKKMFPAILCVFIILMFSSCDEIIDLIFGKPSSSQQSQSFSNQGERLTYYVNGSAKTANVIFEGYQRACYSLDNGGNIVQHSSFQEAGKSSWSEWEFDGIVFNRTRGVDNVWDVWGFLMATFDFYSASEIRHSGNNIIMIYQKNSNDDFIWVDGDYVHVIQRVYTRI